MRIKISREDIIRLERALRREIEIEEGLQSLAPPHIVHIDKKKETNKMACRKHGGSDEE